MASWFKKWSNFDSARSLGDWLWWGLCQAFNISGAGLIAWASSYWESYWQTFNIAGYAIAFLVSIIVLPIGAILTAEARDRIFKKMGSNSPAPPAPPIQGASVSVPRQEMTHINSRYLSAAVVVAGVGSAADMRYPEYRARFGRNGRDATFLIEYSIHFSGVGPASGWSKSKKTQVFYRDRFSSSEEVTFSLVSPCMTDGGTRWSFGPLAEVDGTNEPLIGLGVYYRGRVTMLATDDTEEHCYFILKTNENGNELPEVTGEHMFAHAWEWEGRDPPNGDARVLFR